ncbi:MAG: NADH dehydrogenase [Verrucomicrobia bacterium]|nr:NADH dehydrogenase [Verrucomicrobiota bacterium]
MIWLSVILLPWLIALLMQERTYRVSRFLAPLAPLPALAFAIFGDSNASASVDWLILGVHVGFGAVGQVFLFFTALLWSLATLFAFDYMRKDERPWRFHFFFLLTMSGNFGLILAQDIITFYTCFALMTFAAYGLVIHDRTNEALRAGRIYLITALFGETLLLGGMFLVASQSPSLLLADMQEAIAEAVHRDLMMFLIFAGFGVKAGVLLLHFWLPLAHPVAPVPASAVLSGCMIKAGLLGWMQLLPLGHGSFPQWSTFLVVAGFSAAFLAVIAGLAQKSPKTNLAYSSISQMGMMTVALGIGLATPEAWPPILVVLLIYTVNHALAKGALFLGVGVAGATGQSRWRQRLCLGGLMIAALAIAGAPWTGGAIAKHALKNAANLAPEDWYPALTWLLPLASMATTLLLTRFLILTWQQMKSSEKTSHPAPALWISWLILLVAVLGSVTFAIGRYAIELERSTATLRSIWDSVWPVLLGVALLIALQRVLRKRKLWPIPAGDIVVLLEKAFHSLRQIGRALPVPGPSYWQINIVASVQRLAESETKQDITNRVESLLKNWTAAGVGLVVLILLLVLLL